MAKVIVENTREHTITINLPASGKSAGAAYTFPFSKKEDDQQVHGQLEVESEHLGDAKKHPVVAHYFKEGWLRPVASKEEEKPKQ